MSVGSSARQSSGVRTCYDEADLAGAAGENREERADRRQRNATLNARSCR